MGDLELARQLSGRGIYNRRVLEAIASLTRAEFMPEAQQRHAGEDAAAPIGHGQTISQPFVVAFMSEALDVRPGMKVLEVGTGSGYQAAVLAKLGARVFSIERIPALAAEARERFARLQLPIETRIDDGSHGWPEQAPFDRIIVTAAAARTPTRLVEQLAAPGRMITPVGEQEGNQELMLIERGPEGELRWKSLLPVRFVPLVEDKRSPLA